ncbi:hypothetical protein TrST_g1316 [Triparma strigata]|uniref:Phosphoglycerate mutase n=1 Tax=Triparma strigata TaxID=1606541 RepID=A0A9W7EP81_9STRA|nr:hypothetical protein TrST_g1316 [Triparma strigata]
MRHGNSEANKAGIISSSPPVATVKHGLTELGQRQARDSSSLFLQSEHVAGGGGALLPPVIVSSDFKRASMTANILRATLLTKFEEVAEVRLEERLRERSFGDLDGGKDDQYGLVWEHDAVDANHVLYNVESVNSVIARTSALVTDLDEEFQDRMIFLVAHGDVLQILQTKFWGVEGEKHRSLQHMETAEWREFDLKKVK